MGKIEIFEGERATEYENFIDVWIPNYRAYINTVPKLLKDIENKNLLVAGCGTGNEILAFGDSIAEWNITGVDPSIEMLDQARQRLKSYTNVNFVHGSVEELPHNNFYGAATLLLVLHFLPDDGNKLSLLKEIQQRLSPNAPFILFDITGNESQMDENLEVLKRILPNSIPKEDIEARVNRIKTNLHVISENRLSELLQEAGFEKPIRYFQSTIYKAWLTKKK